MWTRFGKKKLKYSGANRRYAMGWRGCLEGTDVLTPLAGTCSHAQALCIHMLRHTHTHMYTHILRCTYIHTSVFRHMHTIYSDTHTLVDKYIFFEKIILFTIEPRVPNI